MIFGQNWLSASAATEGPQRRMRMQQEVRIRESSLRQEAPKGGSSQEGKDRHEIKKEARELRYTLLNGSTWSTEEKCMRRYHGGHNDCQPFFLYFHTEFQQRITRILQKTTELG